MSAQLDSLPKLRPMRAADLDRIMEIEPVIYTHPWTRGNFDDSMRVGYSCWVIDCGGIVAGYGVLMIGVKEAHLLNLSIARQWQGRGLGRSLLEHFIRIGRDSDVLIEAPGRGRADCYAAVRFDGVLDPGTVARMRFAAAEGDTLLGVPVV